MQHVMVLVAERQVIEAAGLGGGLSSVNASLV